jgi:hypothetical protein
MILFNDAVIIPKYVVSNGRVITLWWIADSWEVNGQVLIEVIAWYSAGESEGSHELFQDVRCRRQGSSVVRPGCKFGPARRRSYFIFRVEVSDWYYGGIRCSSLKGRRASFWEAAEFYKKYGGIWLRRAVPHGESSVVGYDTSSLDDRFPTFRDNVVVSAARVKVSKQIHGYFDPRR